MQNKIIALVAGAIALITGLVILERAPDQSALAVSCVIGGLASMGVVAGMQGKQLMDENKEAKKSSTRRQDSRMRRMYFLPLLLPLLSSCFLLEDNNIPEAWIETSKQEHETSKERFEFFTMKINTVESLKNDEEVILVLRAWGTDLAAWKLQNDKASGK